MKSSTVLRIFAGVIVLLSVAVTANNVTYGVKSPYDRLLARDYVVRLGSWMSVKTETVTYPPKGHQSFAVLSCVNLIDRGRAKNFGYSKLVKGGPGHRNATIYLKSQRGKGLNFTIEYYTRW